MKGYDDPCMENYLALFVSIVWYRPISADEAIRLIEGRSNMKKMCKELSPEAVAAIRKRVMNKNFTHSHASYDKISKKYGLSENEIKRLVK